jgi:hypothetical protein
MSHKASSWRKMLGAAVLGLAGVFLAAGNVNAGTLIINITDGTTSYDIFDQIPPDTNFNLNQITADVTTLLFTDFNIVGLSASSNNPGDNNPLGAVLALGGQVQRTTAGGDATLTITAYQTNFNLPTGTTFTLINTSSTNYSNVPPGGTQTGESWYNPASPATPPPPFGTPAPLNNFMLSGTASSGLTSSISGLPASSDFSLTTQVVLTLSGATGTTLPTVTFGNQAQILGTAVPEPTSVVMMGTAAPLALVLLCKLRRGRKQMAA